MEEKITKIETVTLENSVKLIKVELNKAGDSIVLSGSDGAFFHRFSETYNRIISLANSLPEQMEEVEKKYKEKTDAESKIEEIVEIARVEIGFSEKAEKLMNELLGDGATKKYFADVYEEIPEFVPDSGCFIDFMNKLAPVIERIFEQKIELIDPEEVKSKARMAKYQPKDHKRKQK